MSQTKKTAESLNRTKSRSSIRSMFDEVAPTYDFLNHLLSLGIDNYWRAAATAKAKKLLAGIPCLLYTSDAADE